MTEDQLRALSNEELLKLLPSGMLENVAGLKRPAYFSAPELEADVAPTAPDIELPLRRDTDLLPDPFLMTRGPSEPQGRPLQKDYERRTDIYHPPEAIPVTGPVDTGIPEHAPLPRVLDTFVQHGVNEALMGVPFALQKEMGEKPIEPETTGEKIAAGAGKLTGFIVGAPGKITKAVAQKLSEKIGWLGYKGTEKFLERTGKAMAKEAPALGVGMASTAIGEASRQDNLEDSLKILFDAFAGGAQMGATFGLARGTFPYRDLVQRIGRISTGMALLDAERGQHPLDERELAQKVFDYGLDTFFLWRGIPEYQFKKLEKDIFDNLRKVYEKFKAEKGDLEDVITTMEGGEGRDKEDRGEGVQGTLGEGQKPGRPVPGEKAGGEKTEAGGVFQAPEGEEGVKTERRGQGEKARFIREYYEKASSRARIEGKPYDLESILAEAEEAWSKLQASKAEPSGKTSTVVTERGTRVDTQFRLVEVDDLVASHDTNLNVNPDYPQELQPRQRERAASKDQIERIVNKLIPDLLGESPKASEGAPIVGKDNIVESGNARVIALKRIYDTGHKNAEQYKKWLIDNAETFGLDPAAIGRMKNPVLTRERQTEVDRARFAREANELGIASMSATEQALEDAKVFDESILDAFVPNDSGEINTANNYPFMRAFFRKVVGTDTGRYMTKEGGISQEGITRIRNALFAKAYGDAGAVEKLAEAPDPNIRNILNAMVQAAPKIAKLDNLIASGARHELSISKEIGEAARKLSYLREQGINIDLYLKQMDMFADISALAKDIISMFNHFKRSSRKITDVLNNYMDIVHELGDPRQKGLFEGTKRPTEPEILQAAVRRVELDVEGTLFGEGEDAGRREAGESAEGEKKGPAAGAKAKSRYADIGGYRKGYAQTGGVGRGAPRAERAEAPEPEKEAAGIEPEARKKILDYVNRHRQALELPEIVELARQMLGGKFPKLKKKLGDALGIFSPVGERGKIKLRRDIFADPVLAARVLAHEVGHLADYVSKYGSTMKRGNILGRIASLKAYTDRLLEEYEGAPGKLTDEDRTRLKEEAKRQVEEESKKSEEEIVREIIRETPIYREIGVTPDMILDIWRSADAREKHPELYRRLAEMNAAEKAAIVKQAMKQIVDERLRDLVSREQVGVEVTREIIREIKKKPVTAEWIKQRLRELIEEEVNKRHLYKWETITKELKAFTHEWKPFDPGANRSYTRYRYSSVELYADAFSGLLNDPNLLKQHAPTFYKAWHAYIDRKPELKELYDEFTGASREDILQARLARKKAGYREAEKISDEAIRAKAKGKGWVQEIYEGLVDRYGRALRYVKNLEKVGKKFKPGENPRYALEELQYIASEQYNHLNEIDQAVAKPLKEANIDIHDFGLWHDFQNIIHNRYTIDPNTGEKVEMANPSGITVRAAEEGLETLRQRVGDKNMKVMEEAFDRYWNLRQKNIIPLLEKSNMFNHKLMETIHIREYYGTTDVIEALRKRIEKKFGTNIGGYIFPQKGTLAATRNPFIATVLKDISLIRVAEVTIAKKTLAKMLIDDYRDEISLPKTRWNGKFHETVEPERADQGMLAFLERGKVSAFYVPKEIADAFENTPYEASKILNVWQKFNVPIRALLVNRNPLWMARNMVRDFLGTVKNIPEINEWRLFNYYKKTFVEAAKDAYLNKDSDAVKKLLKEKALVIDRQYSLTDEPMETELDRKMLTWGVSPVRYRNKVVKPFVALWDILGKTGKFTERWAKLAGAKYLQEHTEMTPDEIAHRVRTRIGTPDVLRRGAWNTITNNLFLFSNVGKEGWRSSWEAFKEDKALYAWKTVKFNIVPKLAFYAGLYGAFGDDIEKCLKKVGAYVRQNYIVVPLGLTPDDKGVVLAIPQDYNGQVIGGFVDSLIQRNLITKNGIFDYGVTQNPYNLHPYVTGALDIATFLSGENPYNVYYGEKAIPEREFKAGGWRKALSFGKYMWGQMGGAAIYRFSSRTQPEVENEFRSVLGDVMMPLHRQVTIGGENINLLNTQFNIGNFIRVVDQGAKEEYRETAEEVRAKRAGTSLDLESRMKDHIKETPDASLKDIKELYRILKEDGVVEKDKSFGQFRRQYTRLRDKGEGDARIDAMIQAGSNEEKVVLLRKWKREMEPDEYNELERRLRKDRLISARVRRMVNRGED